MDEDKIQANAECEDIENENIEDWELLEGHLDDLSSEVENLEHALNEISDNLDSLLQACENVSFAISTIAEQKVNWPAALQELIEHKKLTAEDVAECLPRAARAIFKGGRTVVHSY